MTQRPSGPIFVPNNHGGGFPGDGGGGGGDITCNSAGCGCPPPDVSIPWNGSIWLDQFGAYCKCADETYLPYCLGKEISPAEVSLGYNISIDHGDHIESFSGPSGIHSFSGVNVGETVTVHNPGYYKCTFTADGAPCTMTIFRQKWDEGNLTEEEALIVSFEIQRLDLADPCGFQWNGSIQQ